MLSMGYLIVELLNLTTNCNTIYEQKLKAGDRDAVAFIQGTSPVAWQHVNMFGSFEFSDESNRAAYRPYRTNGGMLLAPLQMATTFFSVKN